MIKLMIIGRRAPGQSRSATHVHLRDIHGRMVVCPPPDAGAMPSGYVQNHVIDGLYSRTEGRHAIERDLVTELWFDDIPAMRASVSTPYYLENLKPDEPRFVDDPTVERMIVAERTIAEGPRNGTKLFVFADGRTDPSLAATVAELGGCTALVENLAQPSPFGPPLADIVFEAWFDSEDAARHALDAVGSADPAMAVIAREYTSEALKALHRS